ncbi:MAG: hypothetical protein HY735_28600 [Verrucomicrobia bacterium]|nr:hypothetical protein [Verrucomicrobiota bacterium]
MKKPAPTMRSAMLVLVVVAPAVFGCLGVLAASPPPEFRTNEVRIEIENSLTKVFADEPFTGRISDTLELSAARNESEAGQVVLISGAKGVEKVGLEFSDLIHENHRATIPRDRCRHNFVASTAPTRITAQDMLANRKIADDKARRYPDPLLLLVGDVALGERLCGRRSGNPEADGSARSRRHETKGPAGFDLLRHVGRAGLAARV